MNTNKKILIVEDNKQDLKIVTEICNYSGYASIGVNSIKEALNILKNESIKIIITDVQLPDGNGIELLDSVDISEIPVIIITAYGEIDDAVNAMRCGAFYYFTKPVKKEELNVILEKALKVSETYRELVKLREIHGVDGILNEFITRTKSMNEILDTAKIAAQSDSNILILGETGTGKEVIARTIHRFSKRCNSPFIPVNCGSIPANLLESEMFGHEKGAFTGAVSRHIGKIERADKGTLFLDEIGTLPLELQVRLLRILEEKMVERVGGSKPIKVNFRLIAATNLDIKKAAEEEKFRKDLYFRLKVITINIPPLRERKDDIPALVAHFLKKFNKEEVKVDPRTMELLMMYSWPGNVRELENVIERSAALYDIDKLLPIHLPDEIKGNNKMPNNDNGFPTLDEMKKRHIQRALELTNGKREDAAKLLGIHRNTLRTLLK